MRLAEKVALVTGAGAGIGRAIALAMTREGATLLVADIRPQAATAVAQEIQSLGGRAASLTADVSREIEVRQMVEEGVRRFGRVDILVNNAGIVPGLGLPFTRQVEADWDAVFTVNLKSVFFACKAIAPHFVERRSGTIVNISSIAGPLSSQTMPSYSVAKMGVITFTKILAKDLAPYAVTVNAICPGLLYTDMWRKIGDVIRETNPAYGSMEPRQMFERRVQEWVPMKREQTPEDIGHAAVFLASEQARNITGQVLMVDGGIVM